jgi:D-alanine-D-alanine ligase
LDEKQNPWVLEVNTIPGMTDHSLIPKAASRLGYDFPALCEQIVRETVEKSQIKRAA